ncbi:predicted protein [Naegleria gruberi]|uniref:Predicted protein n=1 Tax=Naegleria gruberi TaxID=5762 RepID=D2V407_NAEGR|nr:uncharacterized protein NAEGRDRAFT_46519 [Naegleria gruberi]EFC48294.1 predicted protein [Naegleria gruberi]|eukprot:XP_002681038.1 predicted protein [Naegleria gruberi strain NEG-M]
MNQLLRRSSLANFSKIKNFKAFIISSNCSALAVHCNFPVFGMTSTPQYFHSSLQLKSNTEAEEKRRREKYESVIIEARNAYYNKEFDKAIMMCSNVLKLDKDYKDAIGLRGLCYYYVGKYESSLADLDKYLEQNVIDFETTLHRAYCNFKLMRFEDMLTDLNAIIFVTSPSEFPNRFIDARLMRANYYLMTRDVDLAFADLHAIENNLGNSSFALQNEQLAQFYEGIALCYAARSQHDKSAFYLTELIEKGYKNQGKTPDANINLKRALSYVECCNFEKAIEDIDLYISSKGFMEMPGVFILKAKALFGMKQYQKALEEVSTFEELDFVKRNPFMIAPEWLDEAKHIKEECKKHL